MRQQAVFLAFVREPGPRRYRLVYRDLACTVYDAYPCLTMSPITVRYDLTDFENFMSTLNPSYIVGAHRRSVIYLPNSSGSRPYFEYCSGYPKLHYAYSGYTHVYSKVETKRDDRLTFKHLCITLNGSFFFLRIRGRTRCSRKTFGNF